ncbi:MAG TPA: protein kinase [Acidocella sp.]|nr:protein kinase [Acidocella sp.]HQU05008.1 protein kinase [Acidocella sp.]
MADSVIEPLASGGWQVQAGFVGDSASDFFAIYEGSAFGNPERGIMAAIARAHPTGGNGAGARDAVQLSVHSFAEGYFGARRTFGVKRAANQALHSLNGWLFGQIRADVNRGFAPVSLSALMFNGPVMSIVHIGACRVYRSRGGVVTPLMRAHVRIGGQNADEPTRAVGLDGELAIDYAEEQAEVGDRYLLLSTAEPVTPEAVQAGFALLAAGNNAPMLSAMVLDVLAAPARDVAQSHAVLADLPLRPAPRAGDVWDGFEIGRTLYHGQYTHLVVARDTVENRDVVLKIPLPKMLQDEIFAAGFMREAWIGSTVRVGNVARYLELPPERRSSLYLVMPLYNGETLEKRLKREPPMSLPDGVGIALKLCEAVQDLAAIEIIHRDLKPENIMLLPHNEVRLLDLGLAYLPGIDLAEAARPGGTLRYMAPELLKGVQANARTEVFSLAVTIYRMFSGGPYPFGQREAVPLARLRPDLPSWLGLVLKKALATDPAERYPDAGAFALALNEGLVSGTPDPTRVARWYQMNNLQIWQTATFIFALGFFLLLVRSFK